MDGSKAFYFSPFPFQEYSEHGPSWTMFRNLGDNITKIVATNKFYEKGIVPCPPLDGWHVSHPVRFYKSNNFSLLKKHELTYYLNQGRL